MNYDHRFHAGNFADVFKHVVLTRILLYLARKPAPFRVIDTHAGHGSYDLAADAAGRTMEWQAGIGRLDPETFAPAARALIAPYLEVVGRAARGHAPYPGSPALALALTRPFDRLIFCELHPGAVNALRRHVGQDRRAKVIARDGYVGLKAFIPPIERRGLVLVDPPYEAGDEFEHLAEAMLGAHAKWREGVIMIWHPIKDRRGTEQLASRLSAGASADLLRLEFSIAKPLSDGPLVANGLMILNPPYVLEEEMTCLLPELQRQLGTREGSWRIMRHAPAS